MNSVSNSRVTIVGSGRSGLAAATLVCHQGGTAFVTDSNQISGGTRKALDEVGAAYESGEHTERALEADLIVISPGVPSDAPLIVKAANAGLPIVSEIELGSWFCPAPIVAITGSNGKTTTTTLTAHMIAASGRKTWSAGNIGTAFCGIVESIRESDAVVLEVSSFQLDHIHTFRPTVGVLLNITPDHLNRYANSFEKYRRSKLRLFENQKEGDAAIVNTDDEAAATSTRIIRSDVALFETSLDREVERGGFLRDDELILRIDQKEEQLMHRQDVSLMGRHNLYNTLAAAVAARIMEVRSDVIRESMATFQGVPHRLEFVREVDGVRYFNDSKATNVNAAWYALESFSERIVLIAGGRDKGNDYDPLRGLVRRKVRGLVAIGEGADKIVAELGPETGTAVKSASLAEAVQTARLIAKPGDIVLLSPACASFDQFENYEDRGDTFKRIVAEL